MKVRYKIALSVIPVFLVFIIALNASFDLFFENYVKKQENSQIGTLTQSLSNFFKSEKDVYTGRVNDWGHWDDTNDFMLNGTQSFIEKNITTDSFEYLDISFIFFQDNDHVVKFKQYYSSDEGLTDFPAAFLDAFGAVERYIGGREDSCGIFKLGGNYYIVAASDVTDSLKESAPSGKLIIGKQIDDSVIETITRITGCYVNSFSSNGDFDAGQVNPVQDAVLYQSTIKDSQKTIGLKYVIPNIDDVKSSLIINMTMPRTLYISSMQDLQFFSLINTAIFVVISLVILILLGRFLSNPFKKLTNAIKQLDITETTFQRLEERGNDEFNFMRKSINQLLAKLETYHGKLVESQEELRATLVSVGDGVISVDTAGRVVFLNPVAEFLTGWPLDEALNQPIERVFNIIHEYTREPVVSPVQTVFEKDAIVELSNHTMLLSRDGTERAIEDTAAPIKDRAGVTKGCVLVFRDFSERKEKQRRIEYLSFHDQLTGLYNRRFFEEELKKMHVAEKLPLSFIYADLNGLKIINDAFGHESGDMIIQWVAELFLSECRADDIAARIGGDEFVMLLPRTTKADVEVVVERLKAKARTKRYRDIDLSISFGWDTKEDLQQSALDVLKNAEDIMYQKKILNNASKRNGIIKSILHTLHVKCPREEEHSKRVSSLCEAIGMAYLLDSDEIKELVTSGELHDIGKIAIDEVILNKDGKLTDTEWAQIKRHPETGYRLLGAASEFGIIAEYVLSHHERWDGKGYPRGLKGTEIDWKARVIAISDAYDAMTSDRPYRKAMNQETAAEEIRKGAGTQFDPDIARVFVEKVLGLEW